MLLFSEKGAPQTESWQLIFWLPGKMAECDMGLLMTRFVNRMERDVVEGGQYSKKSIWSPSLGLSMQWCAGKEVAETVLPTPAFCLIF